MKDIKISKHLNRDEALTVLQEVRIRYLYEKYPEDKNYIEWLNHTDLIAFFDERLNKLKEIEQWVKKQIKK